MRIEYDREELLKSGNIFALKERLLYEKFKRNFASLLWFWKKILFEFNRNDCPVFLERDESFLLDKLARKGEIRANFILGELRPCPGEDIFDCGCGKGVFSIYAAKKWAKVIALDIDEEALKIAKFLSAEFNVLDKINFIRADLNNDNFGFRGRLFDKIILADVFEHVESNRKQSLINTCYRLLKPGGQILIHTDNRIRVKLGVVFRKIQAVALLKNPKYCGTPFANRDGGHIGLVSATETSQVLKKSGFSSKVIFEPLKIRYLPFWFGLGYRVFNCKLPFLSNIFSDGYIAIGKK